MRREFSRRTVLATAAATGAGLLLSTPIIGAEKIEPFSFLIISDTHLGRNNNKSAEKNWRAAIAEMNDMPGEFVLHLGDVVDSAREEQYPVYVESRKSLKKTIHEIPGNHDADDLFTKHVVEKIDRSFDHNGVRFVLFGNAHRDSHNGFISPKQIEWLNSQFADAAKNDLKIVLCCHVPIRANKHPDRGWYVKPGDGQKAFYELHAKYADRILAILHGHFHNGIRGWRDHSETVEVLCPSVCYNQNRGLTEKIKAGTADGFFVDELRPGFVQATLGTGRLTMNYKPLGHELNGKYEARWA